MDIFNRRNIIDIYLVLLLHTITVVLLCTCLSDMDALLYGTELNNIHPYNSRAKPQKQSPLQQCLIDTVAIFPGHAGLMFFFLNH